MFNALYGKGNCVDLIKSCYSTGRNDVCYTADNFCAAQVEYVLDNVAMRDEYDIRELTPDPFPEGFYVQYLNLPHVQSAIGAYVNFSEFSYVVGNGFQVTGDDGRESNTIEDVRTLLGHNVTVMMYAGDADYTCNFIGGEVVANEVAAPGFDSAG